MADDKVLSMSLDEIIKLKRTGESSGGQKPKYGNKGTRGRISTNRMKSGKSGIAMIRNQIRKVGARLQTAYTNPRGILRRRGSYIAQRSQQTNWNLNVNRQRQYNIALGRNRLQVAKRFLNRRYRASTRGIGVTNNRVQQRKMSWRGMGQRLKRGRGGVNVSGLAPNSFTTDQLLRLARMSCYQSKVNRRLSASRRNQAPTGPSLIVSIENERAGPQPIESVRGIRRSQGRTRGNGVWNRQQSAAFGRISGQDFQQGITLPYHTGALDPEIQMVIADIQGKRMPNNFGTTNSSVRRGKGAVRGRGTVRGRGSVRGAGAARGLGVGRLQRFGRSQLARRQDVNLGRLNYGLPLGITVNTLNERFGGGGGRGR